MLEQRLKEEADFRRKVEQQLRDQRSQATSQSAWTQEEVKDLKAQLADKETDSRINGIALLYATV